MNALERNFEPTMESRIVARRLAQLPNFHYLLRPVQIPDPDRVLLVVHGISRQPEFMLRCLAPYAEALNYTLIAPVFNRRAYTDYQRLGRSNRGYRADLALKAVLIDVAEHMGLTKPIHLFGFSGGAQFAHRFVYSRARKVRSVTMASAGWYTAPSPRRRFPYGTAQTADLPNTDFDVDRLLTTPSLTLVGELDTKRDDTVRQSERLDACQGATRLDRARWFHRCLQQHCEQKGFTTCHQFHQLSSTGHDFGEAVFRGGLVPRLFEFCEAVRA